MKDELEKVSHLYADGTPVPAGYCIMPDHYVTTVQVTFRSSNPISVDTLRNHLQERHEVIGIIRRETVCVVQNAKHND